MKTMNKRGSNSALNIDELTNEFARNKLRLHCALTDRLYGHKRTSHGYTGVVLQACSVYRWARFILYHCVFLNTSLVVPQE